MAGAPPPRSQARRPLGLLLSLALLMPPSAAPSAAAPARQAATPGLEAILPADLQQLARELRRHGFRLRLAPPPQAMAYGAYHPASRTLFLAPISLDLGIARQTLLHEAVHAVQSCPSGTLTPIGWQVRLDPLISREISGILLHGYLGGNRLLEREAFAMQGQGDAVPRILEALRRRCRPVR